MADRIRLDTERECFEHARAHIEAWVRPDGPHRVRELRLEGSYPDTGGTRDGQPMPSFIGMLVLTEVLEA